MEGLESAEAGIVRLNEAAMLWRERSSRSERVGDDSSPGEKIKGYEEANRMKPRMWQRELRRHSLLRWTPI